MAIITDLLTKPYVLANASTYTVVNGIFYMICGASLLVWPGVIQLIFMDPPFVGHDELFVHLSGFLLAMIGWLFFFGGRSGGRAFVAATIIARVLFVPVSLGTLAVSGLFPHILYTFAILDPALAIGAWFLLSRDLKPQGVAANMPR
jgi:hypothetical protein